MKFIQIVILLMACPFIVKSQATSGSSSLNYLHNKDAQESKRTGQSSKTKYDKDGQIVLNIDALCKRSDLFCSTYSQAELYEDIFGQSKGSLPLKTILIEVNNKKLYKEGFIIDVDSFNSTGVHTTYIDIKLNETQSIFIGVSVDINRGIETCAFLRENGKIQNIFPLLQFNSLSEILERTATDGQKEKYIVIPYNGKFAFKGESLTVSSIAIDIYNLNVYLPTL